MRKENWLELLDKYSLVKKLYLECEETDPELKTNLQPLNEFRATLDHICRMLQCELSETPEENERFSENNRKARGHICRAFFDVCDMLSINYRNKIIDCLKPYSHDVIRTALPDYYPTLKPEIESISARITSYRAKKGQKDEDELFVAYSADVAFLRDTYTKLLKISPSLDELRFQERKSKILPWTGWLFALAALIFAVAQYFC